MGNGTIFGYDGKYVKVIDKIFNTIVLSLFWLIGCLPIITIGVSTTAMYYTAVKVIKNEEGYVLEQFLKSYRRNLKDGILLRRGFVYPAVKRGDITGEDFRKRGIIFYLPLLWSQYLRGRNALLCIPCAFQI